MPSRAALEDLINVLAAVLVRRLQVQQLLAQILDLRSQLRRLGAQPLVHVADRAEHKPAYVSLVS